MRPTAKRIRLWLSDFTSRDVSVPQYFMSRDMKAIYAEAVSFRPVWAGSVQSWAPQNILFAKKKTPAMPLSGLFRLASTDAIQAVEVPCTGGLAVLFAMPREAKDFAAFEKELTPKVWSKLLDGGSMHRSVIIVPELDYYSLNSLRGPLTKLKVVRFFAPPVEKEKEPKEKDPKEKDPKKDAKDKDAKDKDAKDTKDKDAKDPKKDDKDKDKDPVKQTAATLLQQVHIQMRAKKDLEPLPKDLDVAVRITFDRPYVFAVVDRTNQEILILGRCANPKLTE